MKLTERLEKYENSLKKHLEFLEIIERVRQTESYAIRDTTTKYEPDQRRVYAQRILNALLENPGNLHPHDGIKFTDFGDIVQWTLQNLDIVYDAEEDAGKNAFDVLHKVYDVALNCFGLVGRDGKPAVTQKNLISWWRTYVSSEETFIEEGVLTTEDLYYELEEFFFPKYYGHSPFLLQWGYSVEEMREAAKDMEEAIRLTNPESDHKSIIQRQLEIVYAARQISIGNALDLTSFNGCEKRLTGEIGLILKLENNGRILTDIYEKC